MNERPQAIPIVLDSDGAIHSGSTMALAWDNDQTDWHGNTKNGILENSPLFCVVVILSLLVSDWLKLGARPERPGPRCFHVNAALI